jgi:ankyrin repeat protein
MSNLTLFHCAAQGYYGIANIFLFNRKYRMKVNERDSQGATALHFAVIGLYIKNVQALISLGADPNVQDFEGNTPLHLCIQGLADMPDQFDKLKNIGKELLFCGASRTIRNKKDQTPFDLLTQNAELFSPEDYRKMQYVLT